MEVLDLNGRKGLVARIGNEHSRAWWAARHFRNAGAELAITYFNDKANAHVEPLVGKGGSLMALGYYGAAWGGDSQIRRLIC